MRVPWAPGLVLLLATLSVSSFSLPMKPDIGKILEEAATPKMDYPPARVAWNGIETPRKPFNPTYESMQYRLSPEGMQDEFLALAVPNPSIYLSVLGLIVLLRMMRRERERRVQNLVTIPVPAAVQQKAA